MLIISLDREHVACIQADQWVSAEG